MKYLSFLMLFLFISGAAIGQNRKAAKYNDKIINEQHKITPLLVKFYKALPNASLDELKAQKAHIVAQIDKSLAKVNALPAFEGDTDFRQAAVDWFTLYKRTLEIDFEEILHIIVDKDKSPEEKQKLDQVKQKMIKEEEEIDHRFENAQTEFAKRHGLDLVEHPVKQL